MIHYISSIITAQTIVGMLQQQESLKDVNIKATVFDRSPNQQGFTLRLISRNGIPADVEYSITEDHFTNEIVILKRVEIDNPAEDEIPHAFDRDFDSAVRYLTKELKKNSSNE